jgi:hypothetical protein
MGVIPLISLYLIKPILKTKLWDKKLPIIFPIFEQYIIAFVDFQYPHANHHSKKKTLTNKILMVWFPKYNLIFDSYKL